MSATKTCPECGKPVPSDAPLELCPRCLMRVSSSKTAAYRPVEKSEFEAAVPPPIACSEVLGVIRELDLVATAEADRHASVCGDDASRLVHLLVQAKKLTPYQAGALLQGKARGLQIGQYLVEDKLGVGGMGVVFKARHRPSGRVVALKMLPPSFGRDPETVRRFHREFLIASRLSHPNLVAAIEASEDRGVHYLTMEYIPGYNLDHLVSQGGPMALKLALHCAIQVARGLEAAHAQGVVHRDIKPGNIMIDPDGVVRVLDLGLARVIEAAGGFGQTASGTLTQSGSYMGTVDFLAPEQADNAKAADARADIYSLGCTLYFLLNGKPPFPDDTVLKRLMAHQERPAPPLRTARPEIPEAVDDIYLRMMAKRPSHRPQTISEVVMALEACRTSFREAGDASADLKMFARTILKRAPLRGQRGPDASVFARPSETGGLSFDPDLRLEDLVGDYREHSGHTPLPDEKLPPIVSRPLPKRVRRRRSSVPYGLIGLTLLGLVVTGYAWWPKSPPVAPAPAPSTVVTTVTRAQTPPPSPAADFLRPGSVWVSDPGNWVFTVLERQRERFKCRYEGDKGVYEVNGTIKDGRLRWLARDVKVIAGTRLYDNEGEIKGDEVAMFWYDPASGQVLGRYTLRLQKRPSGSSVQPASAFRRLFNGKDLSGWAGAVHDFEVRDGLLRAKTRNSATIYTSNEYSNFVVRVQFRLTGHANGGLSIRYPGMGDSARTGMCEIEIVDEATYPITDPRQATGSAYGMVAAKRGHLRPAGEWNTQVTTVRGSTVRVELNGVAVLDADLSRVNRFMFNQSHPGKDRTSGHFGLTNVNAPVEYRLIEILELDQTNGAGTPPQPL